MRKTTGYLLSATCVIVAVALCVLSACTERQATTIYPTIPFDPQTGAIEFPNGPYKNCEHCRDIIQPICDDCLSWCDNAGDENCAADCWDSCWTQINNCIGYGGTCGEEELNLLDGCFDVGGNPTPPLGPWAEYGNCDNTVEDWQDECLAQCESAWIWSDLCWDLITDAAVDYPCADMSRMAMAAGCSGADHWAPPNGPWTGQGSCHADAKAALAACKDGCDAAGCGPGSGEGSTWLCRSECGDLHSAWRNRVCSTYPPGN